MDNDSKEQNSDWNRFRGYDPSPDDPHEFGEYMEDLYGIINCHYNRKEIWKILKMILDNFSDYCMNYS